MTPSVLSTLLTNVRVCQSAGDLTVSVRGVSSDSRTIGPGDVFVACPGQYADGHAFAVAAVAAGAAAVVCEPPGPTLSVPVVVVDNARVALAEIASALYDHPSHTLGLVGVTGTDGKTTTTHLIAAILNVADIPTGLISTVSLERGRGLEQNRTSQTTPEAPVIQSSLASMRESGRHVAALEVSSHALVTERVHGCVFDCAVFTNLDPEHLDFHRTLRNYRAAKALLFAQLDGGPAKPWGRLAVVNQDDRSSRAMLAACSVPSIAYGLSPEAAIHARILRETMRDTSFRVFTPDDEVVVRTTLVGRHNVYNWLGAIAAARHFGATSSDVRRAAESFPGVPGRLERVGRGLPFEVIVDFAHTPQGLDATLGLLRRHTRGRLIALFGQAGRRDLRNRARMARSVARHADYAVVTSDDPYDEDPQAIVDDLASAFAAEGWREGESFARIVDRVDAIRFAIELARAGDCVLLAGRGPEDTTIIGQTHIHLVDAEVARAALGQRSSG